jgi:UDP-N-acetylglucosamine 2-epimerase
MKIMTIVGTRPEIIRLSRVIAALEHHISPIQVRAVRQTADDDFERIKFFRQLKKHALLKSIKK